MAGEIPTVGNVYLMPSLEGKARYFILINAGKGVRDHTGTTLEAITYSLFLLSRPVPPSAFDRNDFAVDPLGGGSGYRRDQLGECVDHVSTDEARKGYTNGMDESGATEFLSGEQIAKSVEDFCANWEK